MPGIQGATTLGIHGMGVSTPMAAEVAEATVGLDSELHMPNEGMLTMGLKSMMLAMGLLASMTRFSGVTMSLQGVMPKLHWRVAVEVTKESAIEK